MSSDYNIDYDICYCIFNGIAFTEPKVNEQPQSIAAAVKKLQKADEENKAAVLANATHSKLTQMLSFPVFSIFNYDYNLGL